MKINSLNAQKNTLPKSAGCFSISIAKRVVVNYNIVKVIAVDPKRRVVGWGIVRRGRNRTDDLVVGAVKLHPQFFLRMHKKREAILSRLPLSGEARASASLTLSTQT